MGRKEKPSRRPPRNAAWYASQRRARSHDEAQALAEQSAAPDIPDHPLIAAGDAELITDPKSFADLLDHLRGVGSFAYDTEFIGELTYFPHLCLVQVATHERVALIDPLESIDLMPLWELLADPKIEKIVHAGMQDLEPVVRLLDKSPANVFDTQIAGGFIGLGYPTGLARLVAEVLDVELGKGLTYTSWDRRPLSAVHQRYAADDVRYLPALRDAITAKLNALGHTDWAAEECAALCDRSLYDPNPLAGFHKIRGAASLSGRKRAVLAALLIWRDETARTQDTPVRTLLADQVVTRLARYPVKSVSEVGQVNGLPRPVRERHGRRIVEITDAALADPSNAPPAPPGKPDETATQRVAVDGLWATVCGYCHGRGIDPALVTSRQEIASWYHARNNGTLREGWRRAMLGEVLEAFIEGRTSVQLNWADGALRAERS